MNSKIFNFIKLCGVRGNLRKKPWYKVVELFAMGQVENLPRVKFPILSGSSEEESAAPWEYFGRDWYWWVNLLASSYGWTVDEIAKLDIDDAIGLYQETEVADQMEKEWEHRLSELAYEYVPATKKSKYVPLPRPKWMQMKKENYKPKKPKKIKILRSMMPQGFILNLDEEEQDANTSPTTP